MPVVDAVLPETRPAPAAPAQPRRDTIWRAPLAAACLIAAAAHVPVTADHLGEALYIGVLFIALEVAATLLAIRMLRPPTRRVLLATSALGALAVLAFIVSRTVGLPLIGDDIGVWGEPLAVVSVVAESVMAVGGLLSATGRAVPSRRTALAGVLAGALLLGVGSLAVATAANAETGDHHGTTAVESSHHDMGGMDMEGMDMEGMEHHHHG